MNFKLRRKNLPIGEGIYGCFTHCYVPCPPSLWADNELLLFGQDSIVPSMGIGETLSCLHSMTWTAEQVLSKVPGVYY